MAEKKICMSVTHAVYKRLSDYSKARQFPVRRMHELLLLDALDHDRYDEIILETTQKRRMKNVGEL